MRGVMSSLGFVSRTAGILLRAVAWRSVWSMLWPMLWSMLWLVVLGGAPALAQQQGDDIIEAVPDDRDRPWVHGVPLASRKQAHALFLEGNTIIKEGMFGKAAEKYRAALDLWDHPAFHYNLGIAQMNLDQIIDAYHRFRAARRHGARPIGEDKYEQAQVYLTLLGNQLAEIEVVCSEPGAEVALDGKPLFRAPGRQRVMVRPGGHRAEATKPGRLPDTKQAVLDPGDSTSITLAPKFPEQLATARRWPQWLPWAVAGAGAVVLAGAGGMDWHSSRLFDRFDREFDDTCPGNTNGCLSSELPASLRAKLDDAESWQWSARATYVVGGVTLAASAVLVYLNRDRIVLERKPEAPGAVTMDVALTPGGAGVSARLHF